jgi:hypothetical protein
MLDNHTPSESTAVAPRGDEIIGRYTEGLQWDRQGVWLPPAGAAEAVSYPEEGNALCAAVEEGSFWFRHRNRVIAAVVRKFPPPTALIFDLGGANGYVAAGLQRAGFETVLVEPGRTGAVTAAGRGIGPVICARVQEAHFRAAALPGAGMFDVLEHIEDDLGFLQTVRAALCPGGRLYLTVPAFPWLWSNEDDFAGHYRRYTRRSLTQVVRAAGFEVDFAAYFFTFLPPFIWALRTIPTRLGLRNSVTAASCTREHAARWGFLRRLLESALGCELWAVRRGLRLPVGSSCICVARAGMPTAPGQCREENATRRVA